MAFIGKYILREKLFLYFLEDSIQHQDQSKI